MDVLVEWVLAISVLVVLFCLLVCLFYVCMPLPDGMETTFALRLIFWFVKLFGLKVCISFHS